MPVGPRAGLLSPAEIERRPWQFTCDKPGCFYGVSAPNQHVAEYERWSHACPRKEGPMGSSIIEQAWAQLDSQVDAIMGLMTLCQRAEAEQVPHVQLREQLTVAQAKARGKAEILALMMTPIFADADAVAAESALRWQARQQGQVRQTPGVDPATAGHVMSEAVGA